MPQDQLNRQLRQVDWRFLLRQREIPRLLDLSGGKAPGALEKVTRKPSDSKVDLVVLGFPRPSKLGVARSALSAGGEIACLWRRPRPGAARLARRRLLRAGFADVRLYWPGPDGSGSELWLPLEATTIVGRELARRPPRSRRQGARRRLRRLAARCGAASPLIAIGRIPGAERDALDDLLPVDEPLVLLAGGDEITSKVVGFPRRDETSDPELVVKFSRVEPADLALDREADLLRRLERERPDLPGLPRVHASGTRMGRRAIVQSAINGPTLTSLLTPATFPGVARDFTGWLVALAGGGSPPGAVDPQSRLLADAIDDFETKLGSSVPAGVPAAVRRALDGLGRLPLVWEHRDLGPWNVVVGGTGSLAVIDWEDAEPSGLPGLDLLYFLVTAGLIAEGVLGDPDLDRVSRAYAALLDSRTASGAVIAGCSGEYAAALGIGAEDFRRLRLLCWVAQLLILHRQLSSGAEGPPPSAIRDSYLLRLLEDELGRSGGPA